MGILDVAYLYDLRKLKVIFLIMFSDCRLGNAKKIKSAHILPPRHTILIFILSNFVSVPMCVSGVWIVRNLSFQLLCSEHDFLLSLSTFFHKRILVSTWHFVM